MKQLSILVIAATLMWSSLAHAQTIQITGAAPLPDPGGVSDGGLCATVGTFDSAITDFQMVAQQLEANGSNLRLDQDFDFANATPDADSTAGDIKGLTPDCETNHCEFPVAADGAFGMRLRGYLRVPVQLTDEDVSFGMRADDGMRVVIWDGQGQEITVLEHAVDANDTDWRQQVIVNVEEAGLYPIEVTYVNVDSSAIAELWYSVIAEEFDESATVDSQPVALIMATEFFFTSAIGDVAECKPCPLANAGMSGTAAGCSDDEVCNVAGLCEPMEPANNVNNTNNSNNSNNVNNTNNINNINNINNTNNANNINNINNTTGPGDEGDEDDDDGCGCSSTTTPGNAGLVFLLIAVFAVRRRR